MRGTVVVLSMCVSLLPTYLMKTWYSLASYGIFKMCGFRKKHVVHSLLHFLMSFQWIKRQLANN